MATNKPADQAAMNKITIQKLTIYDKDGNLIWDGRFDSPVPTLGVGVVFWIGAYSDRKWYKIQRATIGLDVTSNALMTEIAVVAQGETSGGCEEADTQSAGEPGMKKKSKEEKKDIPDRVVEDCKNLSVGLSKQETWRNKKGNITLKLNHYLSSDYSKLRVLKIEEKTDGPEYDEKELNYFSEGSEMIFPTASGRIRVIVLDSNREGDKEFRTHFRVLEFERVVTL